MFFKLLGETILKLEHSFKALCNNVKIKVYSYKAPLNVGLQLIKLMSLCFSLMILLSRNYNELLISISEVDFILAC